MDVESEKPRPRLGVSACLCGERVRYDGGHKRDEYLCGTLATVFELVPFCPEVGAGLGVPRPPIHLVAADDGPPRAVRADDSTVDVSDALRRYSRETLPALSGLCGMVLKSGSPSCGPARVPIRRPGRRPGTGAGLFAAAVREGFPGLPMVDEVGLGDPAERDNFLERVFAYARWQATVGARPDMAALDAFHRRHALNLRARGQQNDADLRGRLETFRQRPDAAAAAAYLKRFMVLMRKRATRARHAAVLRHLLSRLRPALEAADRDALEAAIAAYRVGRSPLAVPLTLIMRHGHRSIPEWSDQAYLEPDPAERQLRCC